MEKSEGGLWGARIHFIEAGKNLRVRCIKSFSNRLAVNLSKINWNPTDFEMTLTIFRQSLNTFYCRTLSGIIRVIKFGDTFFKKDSTEEIDEEKDTVTVSHRYRHKPCPEFLTRYAKRVPLRSRTRDPSLSPNDRVSQPTQTMSALSSECALQVYIFVLNMMNQSINLYWSFREAVSRAQHG